MDASALGAWQALLADELEQPYFRALEERLAQAERGAEVYPPAGRRFRAFTATPPEAVRAVILGQDPYHGPGQADGLAFSVGAGTKLPPSLRNIFRELAADTGDECACGDLGAWAAQGVLLLNCALTVEAGKAGSHAALGWHTFTDRVIARTTELPQPIAFILWGAFAQQKAVLAGRSPYPRLILCSAHPSPLSAYRGFFGSRPFSRVNDFLRAHGEASINWKTDGGACGMP